jgi:hypothetical protein
MMNEIFEIKMFVITLTDRKTIRNLERDLHSNYPRVDEINGRKLAVLTQLITRIYKRRRVACRQKIYKSQFGSVQVNIFPLPM